MFVRAIEACRPSIERHGQHLRLLLPEQPIVDSADVDRLTQMVINLLNNATKYTPTGGSIALQGELAGGEVVMNIEDTGIGVETDMLPRIFDTFMQIPDAANRSQGGLGIGLSLVRQLAQLHGGSAEVHSAGLGKGTRFNVRLPAN